MGVPSSSILLDSGATHHVTNDKRLFFEGTYRKSDEKLVGLEVHRALDVQGHGEMKLLTKDGNLLTITDVLYVPKARHTLISTGKLVKSRLTVSMMAEGIKVTDDRGRVLLRGVERHGLPVIDTAICTGARIKGDAQALKESKVNASPRSCWSQRGTASAAATMSRRSSGISRATTAPESLPGEQSCKPKLQCLRSNVKEAAASSQRGLKVMTGNGGPRNVTIDSRKVKIKCPPAWPRDKGKIGNSDKCESDWQVVKYGRKRERRGIGQLQRAPSKGMKGGGHQVRDLRDLHAKSKYAVLPDGEGRVGQGHRQGRGAARVQ